MIRADRLRVLLRLHLVLAWRPAKAGRAVESIGGALMVLVMVAFAGVLALMGVVSTTELSDKGTQPFVPIWIGAGGLYVLVGLTSLLSEGVGGGIDLSRLFHLPLSPAEMLAGGLAARILSPWSLPPLGFFAGSAVGLGVAGSTGAAVLLPAAALLWLLHGHLTFALADLFLFHVRRSRRLMEALGLGGTALLFAALLFQNYLANGHSVGIGPHAAAGVMSAWRAALPYLLLLPGASAASWVGAGAWAPVRLAAAAGEAIAFLGLGAWLLRRLMENGGAESGGKRGAAKEVVRPPGPFERLAFAPFCIKDFRYLVRDPYLKTALLGILLYPALMLVMASGRGFPGSEGFLHYGMPLVALMAFSQLATNHLAMERSGLALLLLSPAPRWRLLAGKNVLLLATYLGVMALPSAFFLWRGVAPWAVAADYVMALSMALIYLGLANLLAVLAPAPVAPRGRRLMPQVSGGRMFLLLFLQMVLLAAVAALDIPVILGRVALAHLEGWPFLAVVATAMVAYSALVYGVLLAVASRTFAARETKIYEELVRSQL